MISWRLIAPILAATGLYLAAAWAGSQARARWVSEYQETLEQISDEIIDLNSPLAAVFAAGATPAEQDVLTALDSLRAARLEFEALGQPPVELAESHAALDEALDSYQQALERLAENLAASSERPFDPEFLALAAHGGEQVHISARMLSGSADTLHCADLSRLLPTCWARPWR